MGWSFRRSAKFGPFRLNFSKSGIGVSAGIRGARISTGPRGTYVNLGTNGVYYRQKVGGGYSSASPRSSVGQSTSGAAYQYPQSMSANYNYPTFPKHGLPRVVTTLGLISVPLALVLYVWAVVVIGTRSINSSQPSSNSSSRSLVNTNPNQLAKSNRERGLEAGFNYALHGPNTAGKNLGTRGLKKLASQIATKDYEDKEFQLGWIEGYKKAIDYLRTANLKTNTSASNPPIVQQVRTMPLNQVPSSSTDGYIRGPRGGCYYLSGSGRRVYVDRELCN